VPWDKSLPAVNQLAAGQSECGRQGGNSVRRGTSSVHSGSRATAPLETRTPTQYDSVATITHLVLIPSYNTGARLLQTVVAIRRQQWPVCVVIDGSTDGTDERLVLTAAGDPGLLVIVLPHNRGKGAAILHGLGMARARGYTHVVTVDADGQHSAEHIGPLVALSRAHPDAMVLGIPVFDASAPAIRIVGHRIANFCAGIVTLWSGIGDSLFGFRVYPVAPLLRVFDETRWMRGFDFESEAVIRLSWQGVQPINLPAPVRYFRREEGGVSHFNYLRDNILLVRMYFRLFAALLPRLPRLLKQRIRSFRR
jgi:glycosyltransferase involved in cell wall biosynthesis